METASKKLMQKKYIDGEWLTKDETILQFDPLVWKVARSYASQAMMVGLDVGDLHGAGLFGLINAYDDYDIEQETKFMSYAYKGIRFKVLNAIRDEGKNKIFPYRVQVLAAAIARNNDEDLSDEEIIKKHETTKALVIGAREMLRGFVYLNSVIHKPQDGRPGMEIGDLLGKEQDFTGIYLRDFHRRLEQPYKYIFEELLKGRSQKSIGEDIGFSQIHVSRHLQQIRKMYEAYEGAD